MIGTGVRAVNHGEFQKESDPAAHAARRGAGRHARRLATNPTGDPIIQANFDLLKPQARGLIQAFLTSRSLPDPVTPSFVSAVQEALSGSLWPATWN